MQTNLLEETKTIRKPSFMQTDSIILHKGIAKQFKFKSSNEYAYNAQIAMDSMRNTLCDLIKHNRGDATQKISIGMTEHFSKTADNKRIEENLYHTSKPLTLYSKSSIRRLLNNLVESLYQTRMKNMSNLLGSSGMTAEFIDTIYIKFHEIDPPGVRSFIPTPKQLENKKAVIDPKNNHNKCFLYAAYIFYDFLDKNNSGRISKKLLEYCKSINIISNFHLQYKTLINLKKIIQIFQLQYLNTEVLVKKLTKMKMKMKMKMIMKT